MRRVLLYMSMSLDGYVASDREHPGVAVAEDAELRQWKFESEIAAMTQEPGPDVIAWGGATFAGALAAGDLIDEYRLLVQPLVLGQGQALFGQLAASRHLDLVEARAFSSGVVLQVYRPQRGRDESEA